MKKKCQLQRGIRKMQWLAIEGTDAVGKTRLACELSSWLRTEYSGIEFVMNDEFSSSLVGKLIKDVIKDKTFFMLGDNFHIPIAETLILGSDFMLQQEILSRITFSNQKNFLISDRGIYSFFVYQGMRLRSSYGNLIDWNKWIADIFSPIGFPDLTICLSSPISQIEQRLRGRGDKVSPESLAFINQVQEEFLNIAKKSDSQSFIVIENIDDQFSYTLDQAKMFVKEALISSNC
ncbi:MAG: deoxynucleoside kinase [Patescibacteria group bacterium]|nr:deoxynucleoside kinase [Patescibacteria group bacterium]